MSLKLPYDQVPHIISKHPSMTNDAEIVFKHLYKILKDKPTCIYSNEALLIASRISRKTLDRCLNLLEKIGAITRSGFKQNRRFGRGLLLNTCVTDTYVTNNNTDKSLNTCVTDADACVTDTHACVTDAHILRYTSKILTTKTSDVVVISENKDKQLSEIYDRHHHQLESKDIENVRDMLLYCKWYLDKGKSEGIREEGRFNQIIKFMIEGTLLIDPTWAKQIKLGKKQKTNECIMVFQEYVSRIHADINLGLIPKDVKILNFEEWKIANEK